MLAISTDERETLEKFKSSLNAQFPFVPDPEGKLTRKFGVKTPVLEFALRYTFVIGPGRKVVDVHHGKDSLDPSKAIVACELPRR